ncbi:SDR family oxidoreductase [Streptomyces cellulosae]|uniref:SDR family oxidoreductase n=1 Tax=Streptomyces cellulosae TaxID=1968 RepID=A0ABW7Y7Z1_STRCE
MNRFTGKTVLITGGTSGMGLATAHRLITEGARVVITGRTRTRVDAAVHGLGPNASGVVADAADLGAVGALMETVRDRHGHLDSLFANAGTGTFLPFPMYPSAALSTAQAKALTGQIVAGRFGRPEEVAAAVAFLASSDASYINGQDLIIDGGLVGAVPV